MTFVTFIEYCNRREPSKTSRRTVNMSAVPLIKIRSSKRFCCAVPIQWQTMSARSSKEGSTNASAHYMNGHRVNEVHRLLDQLLQAARDAKIPANEWCKDQRSSEAESFSLAIRCSNNVVQWLDIQSRNLHVSIVNGGAWHILRVAAGNCLKRQIAYSGSVPTGLYIVRLIPCKDFLRRF